MSNFEEVEDSVIKMMDEEIKNNFTTIVNARNVPYTLKNVKG